MLSDEKFVSRDSLILQTEHFHIKTNNTKEMLQTSQIIIKYGTRSSTKDEELMWKISVNCADFNGLLKFLGMGYIQFYKSIHFSAYMYIFLHEVKIETAKLTNGEIGCMTKQKYN